MNDARLFGGSCDWPVPGPVANPASHPGPDPALALLAQALSHNQPKPSATCTVNGPGHNWHWRQANHGTRMPAIPVQITEVAGTHMTVLVGQEWQTWRFHDTDLLPDLLAGSLFVPAELRGLGMLVVAGQTLYPCRDLSLWQDCPRSKWTTDTTGLRESNTSANNSTWGQA